MPDLLSQSILCPVLIGRRAQVATLTRLLDQVHAGHGQIALISGDAGIGKSRLVAEVRRLALAQGFQIAQGNCFESDRVLPYAPLRDLLRTLPDTHALPPDLTALLAGELLAPDAEPEQVKRRLFAQLTHRFLEQSPLATGNSSFSKTCTGPTTPALNFCKDLPAAYRPSRFASGSPIAAMKRDRHNPTGRARAALPIP